MAEKELRRMSRTELIEIIYALQQNERTLRLENESLREQLEDKTIRIEQSGSIAEAAMSLNRVFESAQAAAEQYIHSVKTAAGVVDDIDLKEAEAEDPEPENMTTDDPIQELTDLPGLEIEDFSPGMDDGGLIL